MSCLECPNSLHCNSFNLQQNFYGALNCISMDDGTFGYVLPSFGFMVETDVGIDGCFAPFWLLGSRLVEWFCLICCNIIIATDQIPSNSPRWRGGRHDRVDGAIFTKQYDPNICVHLTVN